MRSKGNLELLRNDGLLMDILGFHQGKGEEEGKRKLEKKRKSVKNERLHERIDYSWRTRDAK